MTCQHENILTHRYVHDLSVAWACADCGMRFQPATAIDKSFRDGAKYEREECAKVCDAVQKKNEDNGAWLWEAKNCASAIRARG